MSQYIPTGVLPEEVAIAERPFYGGEFAAMLSRSPSVRLGDINFSAMNAAAWTASTVYKLPSGIALPTVTTPGTGYTTAPTVSFTGGGTGASGAAAVAIVANGGIAALIITNPGKGYTAAPTVVFTGGSGTGAVATVSVAGADLQLVVDNDLQSDVATVVTITGTDTTGSALTGTATFSPPGYAENQSFDFQLGYATDVVPGTAGKQFATITSITVVGGKKGARLAVMMLPDLSTFQFIGYVQEKDFSSPARISKAIAEGMKSNRAIKKGRNEVPNLTISAYNKNHADGLARWDGRQNCTAMLVGTKEDQTLVERIVFSGYEPTTDDKLSGTDSEAMLEAKGMYKEVMYFLAPTV